MFQHKAMVGFAFAGPLKVPKKGAGTFYSQKIGTWKENSKTWNSLLLLLILVVMQPEVEFPLLPIHTLVLQSTKQACCSIFVDEDEDF